MYFLGENGIEEQVVLKKHLSHLSAHLHLHIYLYPQDSAIFFPSTYSLDSYSVIRWIALSNF